VKEDDDHDRHSTEPIDVSSVSKRVEVGEGSALGEQSGSDSSHAVIVSDGRMILKFPAGAGLSPNCHNVNTALYLDFAGSRAGEIKVQGSIFLIGHYGKHSLNFLHAKRILHVARTNRASTYCKLNHYPSRRLLRKLNFVAIAAPTTDQLPDSSFEKSHLTHDPDLSAGD
jgi:hypothetical protein